MPALLFGSISTLADTSELQRQAFNQAFQAHGLDWTWDRDAYVATLDKAGGAKRIAAYAKDRGEDVDAAAVHATKSQKFQESLAGSGVVPRPGVVDAIRDARSAGMKVALVTTTTPENVTALLAALAPQVSTSDFDLVVDLTSVDTPKPDGAAYAYALATLAESADACVAVEDNVDGVGAAAAAGVAVVAFPNENTAGQDFSAAGGRVDSLDLTELQGYLAR